jgi:GNAT superfamily N-acetyltransferase
MDHASIRLAKPGDEEGIHTAHMRSIREVCVKDHGQDEIRGWGFRDLGERWVDAIQRNEVWVVVAQEVIYGVGYIRIFEVDGLTQAHLHALYLTPEVLGKNFGSGLLKIMLKKAESAGAMKIHLHSTITAHDFYRRFGFVDSGPMEKVEIGGYPVTAYPMELRL